MTPVIPAPVPVPLPAPVWLLQLLLVFTFILHLLPMNFLVGGGVILTVSCFLGRRDPHHRDFSQRVCRTLPAVVAFTITFGVAPLLFLQLLYGQLFYTSSVLMAWYWLAVVFLIMLGYYGVYWFTLQQEELGQRASWVLLVTASIFIFVAFFFSRNMSFMLRPQDFYSQFFQGEVGTILGPVTSTGVARLMHFVVASLAVSGLGAALLSRAWRREAPELAAWTRRYGIRWFTVGTGIQMLVGLWFLFSLPQEIRGMFLGGDRLSSAILAVAIALAVLALAAAPKSLAASSVAILGALSLMAVIRHLLRVAYLRPYFDPRSVPVQSQWLVFALFVILLLGGLSTVGWMLYQFFRPAASRAPSV
jgi:hypothetical protein